MWYRVERDHEILVAERKGTGLSLSLVHRYFLYKEGRIIEDVHIIYNPCQKWNNERYYNYFKYYQ